jgi:hypothetical protein
MTTSVHRLVLIYRKLQMQRALLDCEQTTADMET